MAVEAVEGDDGGQGEPLVAVDEGVVAGDGVQQRGCLGVEVRIGILAERRGLRAGQRGRQQTVVADSVVRPEDAARDVQDLGQGQVD
ncbi:MAG TPA: hypothetical protein VI365_00170 [Trebonia sp.]